MTQGGGAMRDVVAVDQKIYRVRMIAEHKTPRNADAIVEMAVMRRGGTKEFFASVPHGAYREGDTWDGGREESHEQ